MADEYLIKTIIHLIFEARKGKNKARLKLKEFSTSPATKDLVARCEVAARKTMTPKLRTPISTKFGESPPRLVPPAASEGSKPAGTKVHVARSSERRSHIRVRRCSVCGASAIPGDSVCFTHNN